MKDFNISNIKPHWYVSAVQYANMTGDKETIDFFFNTAQKMFNMINKESSNGKSKLFFIVEEEDGIDMPIIYRLLDDALNHYNYPHSTRTLEPSFFHVKGISYKINLTLYGW